MKPILMGEHKTNPVAMRNSDASGRPACRTCPYWLRESRDMGYCHAEPPTFFLLLQQKPLSGGPTPTPSSHFPPVNPDAFCGRHPEFHRWVASREGQIERLPDLAATEA